MKGCRQSTRRHDAGICTAGKLLSCYSICAILPLCAGNSDLTLEISTDGQPCCIRSYISLFSSFNSNFNPCLCFYFRFSSCSASDDVFALVSLKENEKSRLGTVSKTSSKSNLHRSKDRISPDINISKEKNFHLCLVKEKKEVI